MNDKEFFELLNLYLDHEISTADAARLEAEVQHNRARRSIYQEYCRMQKACRMIAADFETEPAEAAPGERKIIAFNPAVVKAAEERRKKLTVRYSIGFAALAACVAVIFVGRGQQPAADSAGATSSPVAAVAPVPEAATPANEVPSVSTIADPNATFVVGKSAAPHGLVSLAPRPQPVAPRNSLLRYNHGQPENDFGTVSEQLAWIPAVQLPPLQQRAGNDLQFTAKYGSEGRALGNRALGATKKTQPGEEYIGFKLSK